MTLEQPASVGGWMSPDDGLPPRISGRDGFCRCRTEFLRDALGADVVGRDQRDKPADGPGLTRPVSYRDGRLGCISVSPVRPDHGPAKLGLSMTSCLCPSRGRPAARVEDHEAGLTDDLLVGSRCLENERPKPVASPTPDHPFDHRSNVLDG